MPRNAANAEPIALQRSHRSDAEALLGALVAARRGAAFLPALLLFAFGMAFCAVAAYTLWQSGGRLALIPIGFAGASLFVISITAWR